MRFMHNVLAHAGKGPRRLVSAWIATTFAEADVDAARKQWRSVADQLRSRVPKPAAFMDAAENDVLAFMNYTTEHRAKFHSTNPLERLNASTTKSSGVPISPASLPTKLRSCALWVPSCSNRMTSGQCSGAT